MTVRIGSLFSGTGQLDEGVRRVIPGDVLWHVEFDENPSRVLAHNYPGIPNFGDVTKVDWASVPAIDVLTGGFPCQDLSLAGRRAGMRPGTRSGLWADYLRAIIALRPKLVVIENVRGLLSGCAESDLESCPGCLGESEFHRPVLRALGRVLADLADIGYDAAWRGLPASDAGAPHERFRVFVVAWPANADADSQRREGRGEGHLKVGLLAAASRDQPATPNPARERGREVEPDVRAREPNTGRGGSSAENADCPTRGEWRVAASGEAQGGRSWPDSRGRDRTPAADADDSERSGERDELAGRDAAPGGRTGRSAHADAAGGGRDGRPSNEVGKALGRVTAPGARRGTSRAIEWGEFGPAVRRWGRVLGREAPRPVEPSPKWREMVRRRRAGLDRRPVGMRGSLKPNETLSAAFTEWMMGWPEGWVTDSAIWAGMKPHEARNAAIKACGNGVVPQQAALAVSGLLEYVPDPIRALLAV